MLSGLSDGSFIEDLIYDQINIARLHTLSLSYKTRTYAIYDGLSIGSLQFMVYSLLIENKHLKYSSSGDSILMLQLNSIWQE